MVFVISTFEIFCSPLVTVGICDVGSRMYKMISPCRLDEHLSEIYIILTNVLQTWDYVRIDKDGAIWFIHILAAAKVVHIHHFHFVPTSRKAIHDERWSYKSQFLCEAGSQDLRPALRILIENDEYPRLLKQSRFQADRLLWILFVGIRDYRI